MKARSENIIFFRIGNDTRRHKFGFNTPNHIVEMTNWHFLNVNCNFLFLMLKRNTTFNFHWKVSVKKKQQWVICFCFPIIVALAFLWRSTCTLEVDRRQNSKKKLVQRQIKTRFSLRIHAQWRSKWRIQNNIYLYTINQFILAFWLVLTYDLLENRHTIDVITTKFFLLHFKMAERFEK